MNSATDYFESANIKFEREDYLRAISDLTKAIDLKPDYAEAYCCRGVAKGLLNDHQSAISDLNKAINLKPDFALAYYGRGVAYIGLKQKHKAMSNIMRAIELGYRVSQEVLDSCK